MRIVAILASYNERRFIGACLDHLHAQGVETYLVDNCSSDETVAIAERRLGRGLIGIEEFPRDGVYDWRGLLRRKEQLAAGELDADWLIHLDPDEVRLPPRGFGTLAEAFQVVDREGYNAVNFDELTFVPTREAPDHDHPDFQRTLRTYYPFCPKFPHKLTAWKKTAAPEPNIASTGGHRVSFAGLRMYPQSFPMKHYLFLSVPHAVEKYVQRSYAAAEVDSGWHGWRARVEEEDLSLPSASELRFAEPGGELDFSSPRKRHTVDDLVGKPRSAPAARPTVVSRVDGAPRKVALTFDDGPSRWTAEIAATLEAHDCNATFFLRGPAVEERPEVVAGLASAGHELGNHLWSHTDASTQGPAEIRAEIERTAQAIRAAGGGNPTLIRPPYHKGPDEVAAAARGLGVRAVVLRSVAVADWAAKSEDEVFDPVLATVGPGDIVCLHDGISSDKRDGDSREPTVAAVRRLVPALLERDLRPVTVSELLGSGER